MRNYAKLAAIICRGSRWLPAGRQRRPLQKEPAIKLKRAVVLLVGPDRWARRGMTLRLRRPLEC
jgi:hypothetical protein